MTQYIYLLKLRTSRKCVALPQWKIYSSIGIHHSRSDSIRILHIPAGISYFHPLYCSLYIIVSHIFVFLSEQIKQIFIPDSYPTKFFFNLSKDGYWRTYLGYDFSCAHATDCELHFDLALQNSLRGNEQVDTWCLWIIPQQEQPLTCKAGREEI